VWTLLGAIGPALAQPKNAEPALPAGVRALGPVTVESSDRYALASRLVDQTYRIDVVRVVSPFSPPRDKWPVVFVTDGNVFSPLVAAIATAGSLELLPSMYVVSIGYEQAPSLGGAQRMMDWAARRLRDFTPREASSTPWFVSFKAFVESQSGARYPDYGTPGGADAFLGFLDKELKPFVAARYPVDVGDAALVGHSTGAAFVLYALFTSPGSFARYVAASPALDESGELLFKLEHALGDVRARVFVSAAEHEEAELLPAARRLDAQIRMHTRPSMKYTFQVFPDETHDSVVPSAFMRGLRSVFDPPAVPESFALPPAETVR
jgi:hypothetical protein